MKIRMTEKNKILRFDSVGGASGDMILAAFIDLGVSKDLISDKLKSLEIESFEIKTQTAEENGLYGTRLEVLISHEQSHHHRTFNDIEKLIAASDLSDFVKDTSHAVFLRLAEAEASVHNTPVKRVNFHEVGAADSIIDIVGSCLCFEELEAKAVEIGPLPIGKGTIKAAHGLLPVPVPATAALLKDHVITQTDENTELVTPTGAALLTTWIRLFPYAECSSRIKQSGNGFGKKQLKYRPNLLRASLLEPDQSFADETDCIVLECTTDDTTPELLGSLADTLFEQGAMDVFFTSVQMKKHRPGTTLTAIVDKKNKAAISQTIFQESTTLGIREYPVKRTILPRRTEQVHTPYGTVRIKIATLNGKDITRSPEHDDCVNLAKTKNVTVREVYETAVKASHI